MPRTAAPELPRTAPASPFPGAVVFLAGAIGLLWSACTPERALRIAAERYPEILEAPASESIRGLEDHAAVLEGRYTDGATQSFEGPRRYDESLARRVRTAGPDAVVCVLRRLLMDEHRTQGASVLMWRTRSANENVLDAALRDVSTPTTDALLLRALRDRGLSAPTRARVAAVLARPGNRAGIDAMAEIAGDTSEPFDVREGVLIALGDLPPPLPACLRDILHDPGRQIDRVAAAALGASGPDVEAPTLLRDAFATMTRSDFAPETWGMWPPFRHVVTAIRRLAGSDPAVESAVRAVEEYLGPGPKRRTGEDDEDPIGRLHEAFGVWLEAHPEAFDTPWESARIADAASPARARALAVRTVDDVLAAADGDLDVAVVSVALRPGARDAESAKKASTYLATSLDSIARRVRSRVEAASGARAKLDVLQTALFDRQPLWVPASQRDDPCVAVGRRIASCLGWTLTFLSVGDRLGLPLHAVRVPGHVFVRWDDGTTRLNFDPVNGGVSWRDDEVARRFGVPDDPRARDSILRSISRRELLSCVLTNEADRCAGDDPAKAVRLATDAFRLDPCSLLAAAIMANVLARQGESERVRTVVAEAVRQPTLTALEATSLASALARIGDGAAALDLLDRHPMPAGEPLAPHLAARVTALLHAGRRDDAARTAEALSRQPALGPHEAAAAVISTFVARGEAAADDALDTAIRRGANEPAAAIASATLLLRDVRPCRRAGRYVLSLLEREGVPGRAPAPTPSVPDHPFFDRARATEVRVFTSGGDDTASRTAESLRVRARAIADDTSLPEDP